MSYRAFKRLLGETSLERKCRFLFGAGILVLITVSFGIYAYRMESLADEQTISTCRFLVTPIFERHHLPLLIAREKEQAQKALDAAPKGERERLQKVLEENTRQWERLLQAREQADDLIVDKLGGLYQWRVVREGQFEDSYERE